LPPTTTGFRPLGPYTIEVARLGSANWSVWGRTTATTVRVDRLTNGVRYCVRVIAWNTGQLGGATAPVSFYAGTTRGWDGTGRGCPA
jgi:hypothetical protein